MSEEPPMTRQEKDRFFAVFTGGVVVFATLVAFFFSPLLAFANPVMLARFGLLLAVGPRGPGSPSGGNGAAAGNGR